MLFHGTTSVNSIGILEEGFKPSSQGKHGPGVYLTECSSATVAFFSMKIFGLPYILSLNDSMFFIFVTEILESQMLELMVVNKKIKRKSYSPRKN